MENPVHVEGHKVAKTNIPETTQGGREQRWILNVAMQMHRRDVYGPKARNGPEPYGPDRRRSVAEKALEFRHPGQLDAVDGATMEFQGKQPRARSVDL
jgi:hypothetical protein